MPDSIARDLAAIGRIEAVPTILRTIRESTGLRFTFIARVLPDRWIACAVHDEIEFGLKPGGELDVTTTLCNEVRASRATVAIDHASQDAVYSGHPTPKMYGFESYISVPIYRTSGEFFGTVCGLDPEPHAVSDDKTRNLLGLFSQLVALQLDAEERHETRQEELRVEHESSALREQFIAVLGHDVRTPLSSISMGTDLLLRKVEDGGDRRILERVRSSTRRISALVDDVLDLARGRLGGGIAVERKPSADLGARLSHVVDELRAAYPMRPILLRTSLTGVVHCDELRIEQLLQNLMGNALEHGDPRTPIEVELRGDDTTFELVVRNEGDPITEAARLQLFQPFFRGAQSDRRSGLGLGLYIVSEIARSHRGTIEVTSADRQTVFTLRMPRAA